MDSKFSKQTPYIYPPPLFDSWKLFEQLLSTDKKHLYDANEELLDIFHALAVKPPIRSLPCLFGGSIKNIIRHADALFWHDSLRISQATSSTLPASGFGMESKDNGKWVTKRFCPFWIGRAPGPAKNKSAVMILFPYKLTATALDDYDRPKLDTTKIHLYDPVYISSLARSALQDTAKAWNLKPATLQKILQAQVSLLYGVVPSFIYYSRQEPQQDTGNESEDVFPALGSPPSNTAEQSSTKLHEPDFWDGGNVKVSLHPTVANWWLLALNYQADYLAKTTPSPEFPLYHYDFEEIPSPMGFLSPPKIKYKNDLTQFYPQTSSSHGPFENYFSEQWNTALEKFFVNSLINTEFIMAHHIFTPQDEKPPFHYDLCHKVNTNTDTNTLLKSTSDSYFCVDHILLPFVLFEPFTPTIEVPLRLFRQDQAQHDLLTHGLSNNCSHWLNYVRKNRSRLYFVTALLFATHQKYFPVKSPTSAEGIQVFSNRENYLFLLIDDPEILALDSNHPLQRSFALWHTEHISSRTSIQTTATRLKKFSNRLCIILFDGPTRDLSERDCDMLLCSANVIALGNVTLPEKYHCLHLSVADLGSTCADGGSEQNFSSSGMDIFPSVQDFALLHLSIRRSLYRCIWYESNQKRFDINLASHDKFLETGSPEQSMPWRYESALLKSMRYSKVHPSNGLNYIRRLILAKYQGTASSKKLALYMPYLITTCLLFTCNRHITFTSQEACFWLNPFLLNSAVPSKKSSAPVHLGPFKTSGLEKCLKYFSDDFLSAKARKEKSGEILSNAYRPFLYYLQSLQRSPALLCRSKQEYLNKKAEGQTPLGWEADGKMYLDRDLYWTFFCNGINNGEELLSKRLAFLKNVLAPQANDMLFRHDAKTGHWYCRPTASEKAQSKRIGSFLVLDSRITETLGRT